MRDSGSIKKSKLRSRFKNKLKRMKLAAYDPILELNEIENDFEDWSSQHLVLGLKSLTELVEDKRQLGKEIFHIINKKEFKKLLPKRLKVCLLFYFSVVIIIIIIIIIVIIIIIIIIIVIIIIVIIIIVIIIIVIIIIVIIIIVIIIIVIIIIVIIIIVIIIINLFKVGF